MFLGRGVFCECCCCDRDGADSVSFSQPQQLHAAVFGAAVAASPRQGLAGGYLECPDTQTAMQQARKQGCHEASEAAQMQAATLAAGQAAQQGRAAALAACCGSAVCAAVSAAPGAT